MNGLTCKYCAHLKKCIKADNDKGCEHNENFEGEKFCREFKRNTNADRIRAMSDEELAKWLADMWDCNLCSEHERLDGEPMLRDEQCDQKCEQHCLEWLQQPVKEDA